MPTEARRITFSKAELYAALYRHLAGTDSDLPAGAITRIRGDARHDLIKLDVAISEYDTATTVEFPVTQIGEALIGHCVANKIPLPRAFSKSLIITDDNVALDITNAAVDLDANATMWRSLSRRLVEMLAVLRGRKWSLIRASVYGLVFQIVALWLIDLAWGADRWGRVTFELDSGTQKGLAMAISALLPGPLLFFVAAGARNLIVKHTNRPHQYSPNTLDFRFDERHRQAAPLSTAFFTLAVAFSIVVVGEPLVVSQFEQVSQTQRSTPSVALSSPRSGGAFSLPLSPSSESGPLTEPGSFGNGIGGDRATDSGSAPPELLVQKGTVRLLGSSPVEVTFPKRFNGIPNVDIVKVGTYSAQDSPVIDNVTPTSFQIRRPDGADRGRLQMDVEWVAQGPSSN